MPHTELMLAIYKRAMDDIKKFIDWGEPPGDYVPDIKHGREALEWVEQMTGTFKLVAESLDWHPEYLQRVSREYIAWWRGGGKKEDRPNTVGYKKEIRTRTDKLRDGNVRTTKISECDFCGNQFLNKNRAGRWNTYCDECIANRRDTYASITKVWG